MRIQGLSDATCCNQKALKSKGLKRVSPDVLPIAPAAGGAQGIRDQHASGEKRPA